MIGCGLFYLAKVMDDYSHYILAWELFTIMSAGDVKEVQDMALTKIGIDTVKVRHRPRLLSDNKPCYISSELKDYFEVHGIDLSAESHIIR